MINHSYQWQGRHDGTGDEYLRMYQIINQTAQAEFVLIGFSSDEGVRRNKGRIGAAQSPDLIRNQLANLPIHYPVLIQDLGTVSCVNEQLEQAQAELANQIDWALQKGMKPIVLGGGHEVAFGSFSGLFKYVQTNATNKKIGIINFDAHFDLRHDDQATSGTPFLQAAHLSQKHHKAFYYLCIGIAKHSNTKQLFDTAKRLNCKYIYDDEVDRFNLPNLLSRIDDFIKQVDMIYVTVDLDVFSASLAPGVSAPAVKGIDLKTFDYLIDHIHSSGKIKLFDIAEYNPNFDQDHLTARLAAYIAYKYITYDK